MDAGSNLHRIALTHPALEEVKQKLFLELEEEFAKLEERLRKVSDHDLEVSARQQIEAKIGESRKAMAQVEKVRTTVKSDAWIFVSALTLGMVGMMTALYFFNLPPVDQVTLKVFLIYGVWKYFDLWANVFGPMVALDDEYNSAKAEFESVLKEYRSL